MAWVGGSLDGADRLFSPLAVKGPRLPKATPIPFCSFKNQYAGRACYVVGRGRTDFDYRELGTVTEPVFFINDAVCLEKYVRSETFFFAHDVHLRVWLDGSIKSTAVLPVEGTVLGDDPAVILEHAGPVVLYHRGEKDRTDVLLMSRDEIAEREELFVHSGTIHSLLHFIWFCGFVRVMYIGCDGIVQQHPASRSAEQGYDQRLQNRSRSASGQGYDSIRKVQESMAKILGIQTVYLGTPGG